MRKGTRAVLGAVLVSILCLSIPIHAEVLTISPDEETIPDAYISNELSNPPDKSALEFSLNYSGSTLWQGTNAVAGNGDMVYCYPYFGLQIIDLSNPASPTVISELYHPAKAQDMTLDGDFVYVSCYRGLLIFDVADPYAPVLASVVSTDGLSSWGNPTPSGIEIVDKYAYLSGHMSYFIIDVADPYNPEMVNYFDPEGLSMNSTVTGNFAYIASEFFLAIWDVSDQMAPVFINQVECGEDAYDIENSGDYLFVANRNHGLYVFYVTSNGNASSVANWIDTTESYISYSDVELAGDYLYLRDYDTIRIFDVSYPGNPIHEADWPTRGHSEALHISGDDAFLGDWADGVERYDVSSPPAPVLESFYETPGMGYDLEILGNYGYLANGLKGLQVLDLTDHENPVVVASYDTPGNARSIELIDNYIYLGDSDNGIVVLNVSDPLTPVYETTFIKPEYIVDILADGMYAYVTLYDSGVYVFDISTPQAPVLINNFSVPGSAYRIEIQGDYAYLSCSSGGFCIIDISDPLNPVIESHYETEGSATAIAISGNYVYVNHSYDYETTVFDVTDLQNPVPVGSYYGFRMARQMHIVGDYLYAAGYLDEIHILDISTPETPVLAGWFDPSPGWVWDVDVVGDKIYVTCDNGFLCLTMGDCSGPNGAGEYDVADIVFLISYIFRDGAAPDPLRAGDVNCDDGVNVGDAVLLIDFIFRNGNPPCGGCYQ
jgi:hypothetical protein